MSRFDIIATLVDGCKIVYNVNIPDEIPSNKYHLVVQKALIETAQIGLLKLENDKAELIPAHRISLLEATVPQIEIIAPGKISASGPSNIKID